MELGALVLIGILIFVSMRYEKQIKDSENYRSWVSEESSRLQRIASGYSRYCENCIEKHFDFHTAEICKYSKSFIPSYKIDSLYSNLDKLQNELNSGKQDYLKNFPEKYRQLIGNFRADTYPVYLIDEYEKEICKIAQHYEYVASLMWKQIQGMQIKVSE